MYTLTDYLWMLTDDARVAAYVGAIRASVRRGDRVIEVGAGLGFFSVVAALAGAAHVDAIDTNPVIHLGRRIAAANGCEDRVAFHQVAAKEFEPGAPADLLIADLRGPTALAGTALEVMIDARQRFLRQGGTMIPVRDMLICAPVRRPATICREIDAALARSELSLEPVAEVVRDIPIRCPVDAGDVLAPGQPWAAIDYATVAEADCGGTAEWTVSAPSSIDGLAIWFEADLGNGITLSTGPGGTARVYSQLFVPFASAVDVRGGDRFRVAIEARLVDGEYLWNWRAWTGTVNSERLVVSQNSLAERVLDPAALRPRG